MTTVKPTTTVTTPDGRSLDLYLMGSILDELVASEG
jgi:hypothetical protein